MTHQPLRLITANTYRGKALRSPESMELLLPQDGIPTVTSFQEVPAHSKIDSQMRDYGYQAAVLGSHGLAFAISSGIPVHDIQEFTYPGRLTGRRWGLQVVSFTVYGQEFVQGAGQNPVFCSNGWVSCIYQDAGVLGEIARQNPQATVISAGDRNHMTPLQRQEYAQLQYERWEAQPLLPDDAPTYLLRAGKHRWLSWLGILSDPQLDGISVRPAEGAELVRLDEDAELNPNQFGYQAETFPIDSDHLAVQALLHIPELAELPTEQPHAINLISPHSTTPTGENSKRTIAWHRVQRGAYTLLHLDHWLWDRPDPQSFPKLAKPTRWFTLSCARFLCTVARNSAGGARASSTRGIKEGATEPRIHTETLDQLSTPAQGDTGGSGPSEHAHQ